MNRLICISFKNVRFWNNKFMFSTLESYGIKWKYKSLPSGRMYLSDSELVNKIINNKKVIGSVLFFY